MDASADKLLNSRYRMERMLGQGGMGSVYLAWDTALDTSVAVKMNRNPAEQSSTQFLREARLLASLRHPNLPRVTDYFILDGAQYLVMDYVAGKDLDTVLKEEGLQPVQRVLEWARQLGSALSYLHHQSPPVVHRDVKPANIRLSTEGEAILVDFGIAKIVDASQQTTTTGAMGYTPGYAPPEQYGGTVRTGPYTDQYSFAALLYHLLTGQKPVDSIQRALGNTRLAPVRAYNPDVPDTVQSAIERALALRPEERFADVDEFLHALTAPADRAPTVSVKMSPAGNDPTVAVARMGSQSAGGINAGGINTGGINAGGINADGINAGGINADGINAGRAQRSSAHDQPTAQPPRRGANWLLFAGLGLVALVGFGLLAGGMLVLRTQGSPTRVAQAAITAGKTPRPAPSDTPTRLPSETPAPSPTLPVPLATSTPQPSPSVTLPDTETPVPSPTTMALGGGGWIAYASSRADGKTLQIWLMQVTINDLGQVVVTNQRQLTTSLGDKRQPAWSPDGKKLLYVATGGGSNAQDIWMINADGSNETDLTHMPGNESQPAWSPDGKWIAFANDGRSDAVRQIYLASADGTDLYRLSYDQEEFDPAWTPDNQLTFIMNASGLQIVFIRGQADPKTGATPTRAYYVTPSRFDIMAQGFIDNLGQAEEPAWSPDGKWLAYTRVRNGLTKQVYIAHNPIRVVEQDVVKLTDTGKDSHPSWSPDGQWLVYSSNRDGNHEVYIMRSTGQLQTNLSSDPGEDLDPAWQPPSTLK